MEGDLHVTINRKVFPAVGRCIYCASNGGMGGLRDEHIIPFALGGNAVLPKASCADCERVTSYIEGHVSRVVFGPMRAFYGIQKRKRKQPPQTVSMTFETDKGNEVRSVVVNEVPPLMFLREFDLPSILEGKPPRELSGKDEAWIWYSHEFQKMAERLRRPGDKKWSVPLHFKSDIFARFLAKVAHCLVVAQFGVDSFTHSLPPIVLGKEKNIGWLVGGGLPPTKPAEIPQGRVELDGAHAVEITQVANDKGHRLVLVEMRLFTFTGAPGYRVVVGEPTQKIMDELGSDARSPEF